MNKIFRANLFIIAAVSLVDIYFSIKLSDTLLQDERNPLGRILIIMDGGDVSLFMSCKILGTLAVIYILLKLYKIRPDIAEICAFVVAIFQLALIWFFIS